MKRLAWALPVVVVLIAFLPSYGQEAGFSVRRSASPDDPCWYCEDPVGDLYYHDWWRGSVRGHWCSEECARADIAQEAGEMSDKREERRDQQKERNSRKGGQIVGSICFGVVLLGIGAFFVLQKVAGAPTQRPPGVGYGGGGPVSPYGGGGPVSPQGGGGYGQAGYDGQGDQGGYGGGQGPY